MKDSEKKNLEIYTNLEELGSSELVKLESKRFSNGLLKVITGLSMPYGIHILWGAIPSVYITKMLSSTELIYNTLKTMYFGLTPFIGTPGVSSIGIKELSKTLYTEIDPVSMMYFYMLIIQAFILGKAISYAPTFWSGLKDVVRIATKSKTFQKLLYYRVLNQVYLPYRSIRVKSLKGNRHIVIKDLFINNEVFKDIGLNKEWIDKNVGVDKSLHTLIELQCLGTKEVRLNHLYWSQLIPRQKLSVDEYGRLIDQCPIVNIESNLKHNVKDISLAEIERIFYNYSSSDIMRLFKSSFLMKDYSEVLNIANSRQLILPVFVDMTQLSLAVVMNHNKHAGLDIVLEEVIELESREKKV